MKSFKTGKRAHTRWIGGVPKKIRNISVGIPATQRSLGADKDAGIVFRDTYKEYVIPAGGNLVMDGSNAYHSGVRRGSCRAAVSFVPQAGKNYEAFFHWDDGTCTVKVAEVLDHDRPLREEHPTRNIPITACAQPGTGY